ncbi:Na+/H+ antiporter [Paraburkholderia sp. MMS20-SJTR3]|uniref:Na+/H+ antiporter n=1 Tax=Paraburkholderia sejongensis TaxID=2886946 RepID=A0ABS8K620_9BURK|nr:Na+/H+ antiporter [Paraburkholderia sp. MMS20-SJTR3]MCC8397389.1 Na+/H+ antiporter [Paraburkholderia sp. MMS20-SJTR3]
MEIVFTVLILLLAVAGSGVLTRALPFKLPLPLVQIAIGAILAWPRFDLHVKFDPEIFMLLFIPPLLFADGWRIPKREFFMARRAIVMLALGLVFMTVLVVGYFVHALVPEISLPVAFALAAVLSPTDAVALSGIAGKGKIPGQLMHILEGEALMNDASGLVALKFAIAAALTGVFSLRDASISFVVIAAGGLAVGAAVSAAFSYVSTRFLSLTEEGDPAPGVVMTLLIPFAAYLCAERFELSGILAAVAAGMTMNYTSIVNQGQVSSRVRASSTWTMIEFVFNGMVFIMLGLQFPHILGRALLDAHHTSGDAQVGRLIGYIVAVALALYAMRFVWVWMLRWFASRGAAKQGVSNAVPGLRMVSVTTVAGVRGAVTLAGVLSLPELLPNGTPLPGRDLAIFIASGVILLSLLIAVVALPMLLRGWRRGKDPHAAEENLARTLSAQAAIRAVDQVHDKECANLEESAAAYAADVTARVMDLYRRRLATLDGEQEPRELARRADALEFQMKLAAMRAERKTLLELRDSQRINDETMNKLMREVDLSETALTARKR